jgi:hypothetical protein
MGLSSSHRIFPLHVDVFFIQIKQIRDERCPSCLVAGANSPACISMEVFVEEHVIVPIRVFLKGLVCAVDWPVTTFIT